MSDNTFDDILNRLAEAVGGSGGSAAPASPSPTGSANSSDPSGSPNAGNAAAPTELSAFREALATELAYLQCIPPLTDDLIWELDEFFESLPELLKTLKNRPILSMHLATSSTASGGERMLPWVLPPGVVAAVHELLRKMNEAQPPASGNRFESGSDDAELAVLGEQMARDISGAPEERVLPLLALAIGAAVASCVGGVTVGRATYEATHPKK